MRRNTPRAIYLLCISTITACSPNSVDTLDTVQITTQDAVQLVSTETPGTVVRQFLSWYERNHERLASLPLVPASLDEDTTNIYSVDFGTADQYFASLRSSGFISEEYIKSERHYFQKADSLLHSESQTDGPPVGFDYNRIVFSQDAEADLPLLIRATPVVTTNTNEARVFFQQLPTDDREGPELEFKLAKHNGKWLIDNIEPIFP